MKDYLNGGVYSVDFTNSSPSGFTGNHPAVVVQTLKENEIYIVVPFTSYTKDRWKRIRKFGFGCRVDSTNSIARIDKFLVLHKSTLQNQYLKNGQRLRITCDELVKINTRLLEYMELSANKSVTNLESNTNQMASLSRYFKELVQNTPNLNNPITINESTANITLEFSSSLVSNLTGTDLLDVAKEHFIGVNFKFKAISGNIIVTITK